MTYNLGKLESLFEQIKELLDYVEENRLTNKNYFLYLANLSQGEKIEYELTKESIPHLLGINTTYLVSTGLYSSKNSYYAVLEMHEDPYRVYNLAKEGKISYDKLFSKYIEKKIKAFKNNINMNAHEITAISKYYPDRTYMTSDTSEKFEYTIIKEYSDGSVGLIYLAKNNEGIYVPMSSQLLETETEKEETLEKILKNQEITFINSINLLDNKDAKTFITFDEKRDRLYKLREYKSKYNVSIDVHSDSFYYIDMLKNNRNVFAQSEEASVFAEQSKEIEKLRREVNQLTILKLELEKQALQLTQTNQELQAQAIKDNEFKTKFLKLAKELED